MKYVIELSEKDFDNIKHAYTAIFGDIYHIMQGAIANGKALEQKSVLGKIRTEIEQKIVKRNGLNHTRSERDRNDAFLEVLDIIDKYTEESER